MDRNVEMIIMRLLEINRTEIGVKYEMHRKSCNISTAPKLIQLTKVLWGNINKYQFILLLFKWGNFIRNFEPSAQNIQYNKTIITADKIEEEHFWCSTETVCDKEFQWILTGKLTKNYRGDGAIGVRHWYTQRHQILEISSNGEVNSQSTFMVPD